MPHPASARPERQIHLRVMSLLGIGKAPFTAGAYEGPRDQEPTRCKGITRQD